MIVQLPICENRSQLYGSTILEKIVLNSEIIESNNDNESIIEDNKEEENPETINVYGYPSAWNNPRPYQLYKITYLASILDIGSFNPKGVKENEFTKYSDNTDYDVVSGLEKDYHGYSIDDYIVNIEVYYE
jgi:hypothetical protein